MADRAKPMRIAFAAAAMSAMLAACVPVALAADPAKALHVAFTSAEMSFDPQFSADAATDGLIDRSSRESKSWIATCCAFG